MRLTDLLKSLKEKSKEKGITIIIDKKLKKYVRRKKEKRGSKK